MQPSKYQAAVLATTLTDTCNMMVQAVAGSGKTATLKMICERMAEAYPNVSILALAFNKEIAETLGKKLPPKVTSKTMHSLGYSIIRDNWSGVSVCEEAKDKQTAAANKLFGVKRRRTPTMVTYVETLLDLVAKVRNTATQPDDWQAIEAMAIEYDVNLDDLLGAKTPMGVAADVAKLCEVLRENRLVIDFDDMLDLPVHYQMQGRQQFDLVLVDESQDLNKLQAQFLSLLLGSQAPVSSFGALDDLLGSVGVAPILQKDSPNRPTLNRVVLVGDIRQGIYKFRGADAKSMDNLASTFEATRLPLSICYRCPLAVVAKARQIIGPFIEPSPTAKVGLITYNQEHDLDNLIAELKSGDMVMSRTNAPLLGLALKCLKQSKKVTVRGNLDVGKSLIKLIKDVCRPAGITTTQDFIEALHEYVTEQIKKAMDDDKLMLATRWGEKYECLMCLSRVLASVPDLIDFLSRIFDDTTNTGIIFSSIHRAKGLEAEHAIILQPEKLPHPMSYKSNNVKAALEQERNLAYVAVTRSLDRLTLQPLPAETSTSFAALDGALAEAAARRASMGHGTGCYGDLLSPHCTWYLDNDAPKDLGFTAVRTNTLHDLLDF